MIFDYLDPAEKLMFWKPDIRFPAGYPVSSRISGRISGIPPDSVINFRQKNRREKLRENQKNYPAG